MKSFLVYRRTCGFTLRGSPCRVLRVTLAALSRRGFRGVRGKGRTPVSRYCNGPGKRRYQLDQSGGSGGAEKQSDSGSASTRAHTCMRTNTCTHMYAHTHACTHAHAHTCTHAHTTSVHTCMHMHTRTHTHAYVHTHRQTCFFITKISKVE